MYKLFAVNIILTKGHLLTYFPVSMCIIAT